MGSRLQTMSKLKELDLSEVVDGLEDKGLPSQTEKCVQTLALRFVPGVLLEPLGLKPTQKV